MLSLEELPLVDRAGRTVTLAEVDSALPGSCFTMGEIRYYRDDDSWVRYISTGSRTERVTHQQMLGYGVRQERGYTWDILIQAPPSRENLPAENLVGDRVTYPQIETALPGSCFTFDVTDSEERVHARYYRDDTGWIRYDSIGSEGERRDLAALRDNGVTPGMSRYTWDVLVTDETHAETEPVPAGQVVDFSVVTSASALAAPVGAEFEWVADTNTYYRKVSNTHWLAWGAGYGEECPTRWDHLARRIGNPSNRYRWRPDTLAPAVTEPEVEEMPFIRVGEDLPEQWAHRLMISMPEGSVISVVSYDDRRCEYRKNAEGGWSGRHGDDWDAFSVIRPDCSGTRTDGWRVDSLPESTHQEREDARPGSVVHRLVGRSERDSFARLVKQDDNRWHNPDTGQGYSNGSAELTYYWERKIMTDTVAAPTHKQVGDYLTAREDADNLPLGSRVECPPLSGYYEKASQTNWVRHTPQGNMHDFHPRGFTLGGANRITRVGMGLPHRETPMTPELGDQLPTGAVLQYSSGREWARKNPDGSWTHISRTIPDFEGVQGTRRATAANIPALGSWRFHAVQTVESGVTLPEPGTQMSTETADALPVGAVLQWMRNGTEWATKNADGSWTHSRHSDTVPTFQQNRDGRVDTHASAGDIPSLTDVAEHRGWAFHSVVGQATLPTVGTAMDAESAAALPEGAVLRYETGNEWVRKNPDGSWQHINTREMDFENGSHNTHASARHIPDIGGMNWTFHSVVALGVVVPTVGTMISSIDQLNALPIGSRLRSNTDRVYVKREAGWQALNTGASMATSRFSLASVNQVIQVGELSTTEEFTVGEEVTFSMADRMGVGTVLAFCNERNIDNQARETVEKLTDGRWAHRNPARGTTEPVSYYTQGREIPSMYASAMGGAAWRLRVLSSPAMREIEELKAKVITGTELAGEGYAGPREAGLYRIGVRPLPKHGDLIFSGARDGLPIGTVFSAARGELWGVFRTTGDRGEVERLAGELHHTRLEGNGKISVVGVPARQEPRYDTARQFLDAVFAEQERLHARHSWCGDELRYLARAGVTPDMELESEKVQAPALVAPVVGETVTFPQDTERVRLLPAGSTLTTAGPDAGAVFIRTGERNLNSATTLTPLGGDWTGAGSMTVSFVVPEPLPVF